MKRIINYFKNLQILIFLSLIMTSFIFNTVSAQDLSEFEERMTEFALENGITFLVLERHEAPVVSFHTYADVGAVDEITGMTGLAHLFEHMAFKGSKTVGTKDFIAEADAMAKEDEVFLKIKSELQKGDPIDMVRLKQLQQEFEQAQKEAQKYIVHDEFEEIMVRQGSSGFNASTSQDATRYIVSLPSNKVELWMLMESDRFMNTVQREFYKEKNVVMEERRLRTESQPQGRLMEEFLSIAYKAHPYRDPIVGHMSDLQALTRIEAKAFFEKYYSPASLTIAIVGDINPQQIKQLAEIYFGRIPSGPKPEPVRTVEPPQLGEKRTVIEDLAQPFVMIGYHKPAFTHPDNAVFDAITEIVAIGRTSRLHKSLIKEQKIAVAASGFPNFPGNKYPGLFLFFAVPAKGFSPQECEQAIYEEIKKLKTEPVSEEELEKAKTRTKAGLIRQLASNNGLASQIAYYHVITGDWRNLFKELDKIEQVTAENIQRIAEQYFTSKNRTVGILETMVVQER
ncbi:MAG: M16 family metallopeptidase [Planctomycetota bacterium]|jgi:predicted Zn-dependent peptidase